MKITQVNRVIREDFSPGIDFGGEFDLMEFQDLKAKCILENSEDFETILFAKMGKKFYDEIMELTKKDLDED